MCGRTSLFTPLPELESRFDATAARSFEPRYNVAPGDDLAVVRNDDPTIIDLASWGLVPHWADSPDDSPKPINARAETLSEKPTFSDAYERRRCLVLADGFYEWRGRRGRKQPYRVALADDAPFAMAGLWERWTGNGTTLVTTTVVTTDANDLLAPIHDRMPVVLAPGEERTWLDTEDPEAREALLDPYDGDDLRAYPVSRAVNDPGNDGPDLIDPVDDGGQTDLGDFA